MKRWVIGGLIAGFLSVTLLQPARAADVSIGFDGGDSAYTIVNGNIASGAFTGNSLFGEAIGGDVYQLDLTIPLDSACTYTGFNMDYRAVNTRVGLDIGIGLFIYDIDNVELFSAGSPSAPGLADDTHRTFPQTFSISGADHAYIYINWGSFSTAGGSAEIDNISFTCTGGGGGGLTKPIAAADVSADFGMFDYDYVHNTHAEYESSFPVEAFSENFGANVAAVADGTVISVTPYTPDSCSAFLQVFSFGNLRWCNVVIPGPITENAFSQTYSLEMVNNWKVVIEDASDASITYEYILTAPTVKVGDVVAAGCVIGQTIQIKQLPLGIVQFAFTVASLGVSGGTGFLSNETNAGVVFVSKYDTGALVSLYPSLTEEPDLASCKEQQLSACVNNNPNLKGFAYYERESDVSLLDGGGATIPPFNYILQKDILIDPEQDYTLSIQARQRSAGGDDDRATVNLQIGSQLDSFDVPLSWRNITLTTSGSDWHTDNLTTIFISNQPSSVNDIEIRYICLAPVTASTAPGGCYFANNEFDADGTEWTFSGTTFGTGQAFMRDGDYIFQTGVKLLPDESTSHIYTIRAVARLLATGDYTGQIGKSVTLNYTYPDGGTPTEVGTIDSTLVAQQGINPITNDVVYDYPYVLEATLEITEETTSIFKFEVSVTDTDHYLNGIRLDSVCIDPQGDGTFPGQTGTGGYTPPFVVGCAVVPVPVENSIGSWVFYHWANLKRFFSCDLMKLLNKWFTLFDSFQRTIKGVARWWIALVHRGNTWLTSFMWWANGSVRNMAMGQVTTITESGGCHDIFCAITDVVTTLGNLLNPIVQALNNVVNVLVGVFIGVVNLFFTLIGGLVGFVVALLSRLFGFLGQALALLQGLIGAYNGATPTAIPGLPTCATDPNSSIFCAGIWVMDNTIFAGRWNTLFTLILSILAIHLILWTIGEFRDILLKTWGSS